MFKASEVARYGAIPSGIAPFPLFKNRDHPGQHLNHYRRRQALNLASVAYVQIKDSRLVAADLVSSIDGGSTSIFFSVKLQTVTPHGYCNVTNAKMLLCRSFDACRFEVAQ
jgi:hypothetical protein